MEAMILAGGLGTRLQSRLHGVPKPMAPVAGRPFLELLLDRLREAGFERVILSVGHLREAITGHFGDAWKGLEIRYAIETEPLGTGGAIRLAMECASAADVFVLNGDTWLELEYRAMLEQHVASGVEFTMALSHVEDRARYGGVEVEDGRVMRFVEKGVAGPGWINGGVYLLKREFAWPMEMPTKFSFESDLLYPRLAAMPHGVYTKTGFFLDIGIPEDLDRAQTEIGAKR